MGVKVRERPKGSGVWWIFIDHQGKRKAKRVGKDRKLALEVAKKIEARMFLAAEEPDSSKEECPTFKMYAAMWLSTYASYSLKSSTRKVYECNLKKHIIPDIGKKRIDEITTKDINAFIYKKFKEGLRSQTIKNLRNCVSAILRAAKEADGFIDTNPAKGVRIPVPENEKSRRQPDPFTRHDWVVFESTVKEHFPEHYPLVVTGFRTGMRIGELLALQWGDIDFRNRIIRVQRNLVGGKVTTPKSKAGFRDIRMTTYLAKVLTELKARRKQQTLEKGWKQVPPWVFVNERGNPLWTDNFRSRIWNRAIEKSGLRHRTPHDMRHTYATLRLSKGDPLAEVAKEMGHSSAEVTFKTYYKWLPKESLSDIDELDRVAKDHTQPSATYTQPHVDVDC